MRKFLNIKIGKELVDLLQSHNLYKTNWKTISPAFHFLKQIKKQMDKYGRQFISYHSSAIRTIFKNYTGGEYKPYLTALEDLGLLMVDEYYISPELAKEEECESQTKSYMLTDKCISLLTLAQVDYLKQLITNKQMIRSNQQSISKRGVMHRTYADHVTNYIYDALKHTEYDIPAALNMISGSRWSDAAKENVASNLNAFVEKKFNELEYDSNTGRMYHEHIAMRSDFRVLSTYKNMAYSATVDIRCCHPLFLSTYLYPLYLHYVGSKGDNSQVGKFDKEHQEWIKLFTNNDLDPREVILTELSDQETYFNIGMIKEALVETINGSKQHPEILSWMEQRFPVMYAFWQSTNVKETGTKITKEYEHRLIFREAIYRMAGDMGIKLTSEHDGFGVYALSKDGLTSKLDCLVKEIRQYSITTWGVPLVMKIKVLHDKRTCIDTFLSMEGRRKDLDKEYDKLAKMEHKLRKKAFATNARNDWIAYYNNQTLINDCLKRYSDVIQYWEERGE